MTERGAGGDRARARRRGAADPRAAARARWSAPTCRSPARRWSTCCSGPRSTGCRCAARWSARQHAYVLVRDWLAGGPRPVDRAAALAELARRYLAGHGPAVRPRPRALGRAAAARRPRRPERDRARAARRARRPGRPARPAARMAPLPAAAAARRRSSRCWSAGARAPTCSAATTPRSSPAGIFRNFALVDGPGVATWRWDDGTVSRSSPTRRSPGRTCARWRPTARRWWRSWARSPEAPLRSEKRRASRMRSRSSRSGRPAAC